MKISGSLGLDLASEFLEQNLTCTALKSQHSGSSGGGDLSAVSTHCGDRSYREVTMAMHNFIPVHGTRGTNITCARKDVRLHSCVKHRVQERNMEFDLCLEKLAY